MKDKWMRWRFTTESEDYRPITFPPPGPYWCSGYDPEGDAILIAYLPRHIDPHDYWPEAKDLQGTSEPIIRFTSRFRRPEWWSGEPT